MTGLMMKDALVMRKTLRLYALFLLFYSGLAVLGVFPMSMALAMVEVIVMVLPISSFSYDEAAKWDRYAAVLPVGRTAVVKARYLFLLLVLLAAAAIGLVGNIILDPLMIFGIGPFPQMGVAGAATATVLAQAIVTAMFLLAARREMTVFPQIHIFQASQWRAWAEILKIGLPVSIQSMFFSGLSMILARLVAGWGDAAIAAQKVGSQIESISYTTAEGFATAVNAFIAQNFGAGRMERIRKGYWTAIGMIVVWSGFTTLMLVVFPVPLFRIFIPDDHVLQTGVSYLRIMGYSQILMCLEITSSGAFQGLGRPMPPTLAGIIGNAARIPLAVFLSATVLGLDGVWWSISISSIAKGIVVFTWFVVILRRYTHRQAQGVDGLE